MLGKEPYIEPVLRFMGDPESLDPDPGLLLNQNQNQRFL
jgi:hypothetical protein